jgi:hypothetical protein
MSKELRERKESVKNKLQILKQRLDRYRDQLNSENNFLGARKCESNVSKVNKLWYNG